MKIGFFIAYSPSTKFQNQGLGRQFTQLIEGFYGLTRQPVTIICPAWLRNDIIGQFSGMPVGSIEVIGNKKMPFLLPLYMRLKSRKFGKVKSKSKRAKAWETIQFGYLKARRLFGFIVVDGLSSKNPAAVILSTLLLALIGLTLLPLVPVAAIGAIVAGLIYWLGKQRYVSKIRSKLSGPVASVKNVLIRLEGGRMRPIRHMVYTRMAEREMSDMKALMGKRADIDIWYSPTVFWPEVNSAPVPTVQCFPDIMMADFPVSFATDHPSTIPQFERAKLAVETGKHFIAYSKATAKSGLQDRYDVSEDRIHIIPHAAMNLSRFIGITGTLDDEFARRKFATNLIEGHRNVSWQGSQYLKNFSFNDTKYIFYASQFRPNKNVLNLLRAYEIVLRKRFKYVKLVLTGTLAESADVKDFIFNRRLQYDVVIAYDVPPQVLAGFYHRAELAVNPSLFEGGMPFTFTEALSVDTPVVMARIPQTTETLGTNETTDAFLFDPLSVEDMADKIVYGLENRQQLLDAQKPIYDELKGRTWVEVAEDHVRAFEKILNVTTN